MHGYQKWLFFYSFVALTVLLITSAIFLASPEKYFFPLLFFPVALFFWLKFTSPEAVSTSVWSIRLFLILIGLSALFLGSYFSYKQLKPYPTISCQPTKSAIEQIKEAVNESSPSGQLDQSTVTKLGQIENDLAEVKAMLQAKNMQLGVDEQASASSIIK